MSGELIRVLVVDDHALVRKSISEMLSREPDLEVIGTAENGRDAIEKAKDNKPDVIVMDVSMPELDGIRAAGVLQALGISSQIIMLSMHHSSALVQQARKNGAAGYVVKQQSSRDLIPAIRAAFAGTAST
ncbi:MAG: response regulator transcription factor [Candidatus Promineifilaceae bacterium]|nr:response regulator transcription factor [Candidatus Promineifilaceae bacterium]